MKGFKLLAIRPLIRCNSIFTKVLEPGNIYKFYHEYEFRDQNNQIVTGNESVCQIICNKAIPDTFYQINGKEGHKIIANISAIVGKNGCGKSSLIDLLYYAIYCLGSTIKLDNKDVLLKKYPTMLVERMERLEQELINDSFYDRRDLQRKKVKQLETIRKRRLEEEAKHEIILKDFGASIYYEEDGQFFELLIDKANSRDLEAERKNPSINVNLLSVFLVENQLKESILNNLFYTISINYSHYSLNSKEIGNWINTLFHKNDGYKTPLVINPMRDNGIFNINDENKLAKQRLLTNVIVQYLNLPSDDEEVFLTDKQSIISVNFSLHSIYKNAALIQLSDVRGGMNLEVFLFREFLEDLDVQIDENYEVESLPYFHITVDYIINKIYKIIQGYREYSVKGSFHRAIDNPEYAEKIAELLNNDKSHIVFKLKQAINFLTRNHKIKDNLKWKSEQSTIFFTLKELCDWMGIKKGDSIEAVYEKIPPPIFEIDFSLSANSDDKMQNPTFEGLSSGEKQLIHSMQSVFYHLNNLESIHRSNETTHRIKYHSINIVFDEIELYFHPDLQRQFISDLLKGIERLSLEKINGINILFATHSPFILSDIPSQNILRLKVNDEGKSEPYTVKDQTFGSNIHDLLANDFFLEDGFMGEFAKEKINETIQFLTMKLNEKRLDEEFKGKLDKHSILKKEFLEKEIELLGTIVQNTGFDYHEKIIELVGEPALKAKMKEMYQFVVKN